MASANGFSIQNRKVPAGKPYRAPCLSIRDKSAIEEMLFYWISDFIPRELVTQNKVT
jgi:hypothetical protein